MPNNKKGFTLIELLVVMGILGILMAVTILVINPAEYLKRARDTQRISDIGTINTAVGLALSNGNIMTSVATCYTSTTSAVTFGAVCGASATSLVSATRVATGTGWVYGIDASGSMGTLPIDPTNNTTALYYIWMNNGSSYEIAAKALESAYYTTAPNNIAANDGGLSTTKYEIGSNLGLVPLAS